MYIECIVYMYMYLQKVKKLEKEILLKQKFVIDFIEDNMSDIVRESKDRIVLLNSGKLFIISVLVSD